MNKMMRLTVVIPKNALRPGQSELSAITDHLWRELRHKAPNTIVLTLDWYAKKEVDDQYWFKCCDFSAKFPGKYLQSLMDDGYQLSTNAWTSKAWIDTNGRIYPCHEDLPYPHYEIAVSVFPDAPYPDEICMNLGWIRVGCSAYNGHIINRRPTQEQIDALYQMGQLSKLLIQEGHKYRLYQ